MADFVDLSPGTDAVLITEDGGVKKEVLQPGKGDLPGKYARCLVHYVARLGSDGEVFMDTRKETNNSEPMTLYAGRDTSFRDVGINLAVATMQVGEKSRVFVSPKYGYGEKGNFSFPMVPPNADLVYDMELVGFENQNADEKPVGSMLYEERLEAAERRRQEGNEAYAKEDYEQALSRYVVGLSFFSEEFMMQLEGTFYDKANAIRTRLLLNMSAVKLKLEAYHDVIACCSEVLKYDPKCAKAWYRRGKARLELQNAETAEEDLKQAIALSPGDKAVQMALMQALRQKDADRKAQSKLFKGKFNNAKKGLFSDAADGEPAETEANKDDAHEAQVESQSGLYGLLAWLWMLVQRIFGLGAKPKQQ